MAGGGEGCLGLDPCTRGQRPEVSRSARDAEADEKTHRAWGHTSRLVLGCHGLKTEGTSAEGRVKRPDHTRKDPGMCITRGH